MAEIGAAGTSGGYGQSVGRIEGGQPNPWQQSAPVVASVAPWVRQPHTFCYFMLILFCRKLLLHGLNKLLLHLRHNNKRMRHLHLLQVSQQDRQCRLVLHHRWDLLLVLHRE